LNRSSSSPTAPYAPAITIAPKPTADTLTPAILRVGKEDIISEVEEEKERSLSKLLSAAMR
jgi:hypothetical protein